MDDQSVIAFKSVTLERDGKPLLQGFDVTIAAGQKVLVTGPSGCGKSSLLKCLLGLFQPTTGQVEIHGEVLDESSVWNLRQRMSYVGQEPELGDATVREVLERPLNYKANRHLNVKPDQMIRLLERLRLPGSVLEKTCSQLSGGEKQRVALVGALLLQRSILLLDEVTSALDPESRHLVAELLAEQTEQTLVMISHDPSHFGFATQTLSWPTVAEVV